MYDKPKVTIDLEEYNDLVAKANKPLSDNEISCKTIIAHIINCRGDLETAFRKISAYGVSLSFDRMKDGFLSAEDIYVKKTL